MGYWWIGDWLSGAGHCHRVEWGSAKVELSTLSFQLLRKNPFLNLKKPLEVWRNFKGPGFFSRKGLGPKDY